MSDQAMLWTIHIAGSAGVSTVANIDRTEIEGKLFELFEGGAAPDQISILGTDGTAFGGSIIDDVYGQWCAEASFH
jgi:DNA-binding ferritin-like protein (Dps family)